MLKLSHSLQALPTSYLAQVRHQGLDDLGQPVERIIAQGGEPCRDVLRRAHVGEELILASYCPFTIASPYKEYGPIFILAHASAEDVANDSISCSATSEDRSYLQAQFVLRAYSEQERIIDACISSPEKAEGDLARLFSRAEVAFVLIRFAAYGCYAARINR
jgi:hypothetical protein